MNMPGFCVRMRSTNSCQNECGNQPMVSMRSASAPCSIHCEYAPTRYSITAGLFSLKSDSSANPGVVL